MIGATRAMQHSVRDFVNIATEDIEIEIRWEGNGVDEKGYSAETNRCVISIDPRYFRPTGVETLLGDASKAKRTWVGDRKLHSVTL